MSNIKKIKTKQLGMNPSTASNRLIKDILFAFIQQSGHTCFHCGENLTREDFSIEHITPWLHSEDPKGLYFNLSNIAFSHLNCNVSASRRYKPKTATCPSVTMYRKYGCRCKGCTKAQKESLRKYRKESLEGVEPSSEPS